MTPREIKASDKFLYRFENKWIKADVPCEVVAVSENLLGENYISFSLDWGGGPYGGKMEYIDEENYFRRHALIIKNPLTS